jgi:hypothetical protein
MIGVLQYILSSQLTRLRVCLCISWAHFNGIDEGSLKLSQVPCSSSLPDFSIRLN